jgi:hypothetical protein
MSDSDMEYSNDNEVRQSRRAVLKMLAGAPLLLTFGMVSSPLMHYLKPTMSPLDFFQPADFPAAARAILFNRNEFPEIWSCVPFMFSMKYPIFNPEQYEIRKIPGFAIRVGDKQIVAFSRTCPLHGVTFRTSESCTQHDAPNHYLNYIRPKAHGSCGCGDRNCGGDCIGRSKTPVLVCPRDGSVFDVCNNGIVLRGPAWGKPRQFVVEHDGDTLRIARFEDARIVV